MNKNLQDIDKLFTQFLKDYIEEPPPYMWQQIENDLNKKDAEKYKTKYGSLKKTVTCIIFTCAFLLLSDALQFLKHNNTNTALTYKSLVDKSRLEEHNINNKKTHNNNNEKGKESNTVLKEIFINAQAPDKKIIQNIDEITMVYKTLKTYNKTQERLLSSVLHKNIKTDTMTFSMLIANALKKQNPIEHYSGTISK